VFRRPLTVFAATLAASQFLLACGGTEETKQNALPVAAAPLESARFTDSVDTITTLESVQIVNLASRANGRILRLGVREGQLVKQGQLLMQLDQTQQRAELASAIAAMEANKKDFQRFEYLAKQGAASDFQRDRFREAYISSIQDVKSRQADLAFNNLQAPIDGVISDLVVRQGDVIQEGDPFTKIIRNDRLLARIDLPAVRSAQVREGAAGDSAWPRWLPPPGSGHGGFRRSHCRPHHPGIAGEVGVRQSWRDPAQWPAAAGAGGAGGQGVPIDSLRRCHPVVGPEFRVFVVGSFADLQRLPGQLKKEDIDKLAPPALPSGTQFALQTPVRLGPLQNNRYPVLSGVLLPASR
jgi:biotin carboxyl carrier protein